jgi:hypothetical protein
MADGDGSAHRSQDGGRRRQRPGRILLAACLAALVAIAGIGLWRLGSGAGSSTDEPTAVATTPVPDEADRSTASPGSQCAEPVPSLAVVLSLGATDAEIGAVRARLEGIPDATRLTYVDQDDAYDEFAQLFRDSPEMLDSVAPEDLPVSFRLSLGDSDPGSIAAELMSVPGVADVIVNPCELGSSDGTGGVIGPPDQPRQGGT